jgi:hypothetical protein
VTKLLPPFSSVKVINLRSENINDNSPAGKFIGIKKKVVKESFSEEIILADSIRLAKNELIFFKIKTAKN